MLKFKKESDFWFFFAALVLIGSFAFFHFMKNEIFIQVPMVFSIIFVTIGFVKQKKENKKEELISEKRKVIEAIKERKTSLNILAKSDFIGLRVKRPKSFIIKEEFSREFLKTNSIEQLVQSCLSDEDKERESLITVQLDYDSVEGEKVEYEASKSENSYDVFESLLKEHGDTCSDEEVTARGKIKSISG